MKYLKLYEDFDWNDDDFDFEEEFDEFEGEYYLIRKANGEHVLNKIYIEKTSNGNYDYFEYDNGHIIWRYITKEDVKSDLKHEKYNSIRLFKLDEWGTDKMKKEWKDLTGKDLPLKYTGEIRI